MGIVRSLVSHLANSPENRHDQLTDGLVDKGEGVPPETLPLPTPEELTMQKQACEGLVGRLLPRPMAIRSWVRLSRRLRTGI